ncbi:MAG: type IV pili methyl-accepting chemotaxis transducer N-terminal domain-containing protein [Rhodospirillaceae bacterium]|jgi:nitrate/nitrite-specific signal transduction histidine kinase
MTKSPPGLIRNFTVAYVAALLLIAALIGGSTLMLTVATADQIDDAAALNISGKQRMLSQRIAQFADILKKSRASNDDLAASVMAAIHRYQSSLANI